MIINIILAAIGFGFLVFVHELGHFLVAKWIGVRVDAFSLGFGPFIKIKRGDTEYRLSAIPLGGYVKMAGEEPKPDKPPATDEFYGKSVGRRAMVFAAGVTMNLIFGLLIFVAAYQVGVPTVPAVVGDVAPGSPAWQAGLQAGDRIVGIDRISPPIDFEDLKTTVTLAGTNEWITLQIQRNGESFAASVRPQYDPEIGLKTIGIAMPLDLRIGGEAALRELPEEDRALVGAVYEAGLQAGDEIIAAWPANAEESTPVGTLDQFQGVVDDSGGGPVKILYHRPGSDMMHMATLTPQPVGEARWIGLRYGSTQVSAVRSGSWAEEAGLRPGDVITSVAGRPVRTTSEVMNSLTAGDATVTIGIVRDGTPLEVTVPAQPTRARAERSLALAPGLVVDSLWPGYPADKAGIRPGDLLVSVNGEALTGGGDLAAAVMEAKGMPVTIGWMRDGAEMNATVEPQQRRMIALPIEPPHVILRAGLVESMRLGTRKAIQWTIRIYGTLRSLIVRDISPRHLSGPLSIAYITYAAATRGMGTLLYILGVLSVNLAIFNLLPIPVLDGGHLLFAAIEKVRGRPLDERIRAAATYAGLALILALVVVAFWNDIRTYLGHFFG